MNNEFLKMQKLAGLITESQYNSLNLNHSQTKNKRYFQVIDDVIKNTPYPVIDAISLEDEMEYTDLIDSVADAIGEDFTKAREILYAYGSAKYPNNESQIKEIFAEKDESYIRLTPSVQQYIDDSIANIRESSDDEEWENLKNVEFWEQDFEENILIEFGEKYPDAYMISPEVSEYVANKVYENDDN